MDSRQRCEDRIDQELAGRLADIPDLVSPNRCRKCAFGEDCEEHLTGANVLSVDKHIYYDIHLSTGGPADFFRVYMSGTVEESEEIIRIEYHFQDWYDGAVRQLYDEDFCDVEDWIRYNIHIPELG
jgi:hypothetical protein